MEFKYESVKFSLGDSRVVSFEITLGVVTEDGRVDGGAEELFTSVCFLLGIGAGKKGTQKNVSTETRGRQKRDRAQEYSLHPAQKSGHSKPLFPYNLRPQENGAWREKGGSFTIVSALYGPHTRTKGDTPNKQKTTKKGATHITFLWSSNFDS